MQRTFMLLLFLFFGVTYSIPLDPLNPPENNFENKLNTVIDKHMPLKKLSQRELKQKNKPWITIGIQNSMNLSNQKMCK